MRFSFSKSVTDLHLPSYCCKNYFLSKYRKLSNCILAIKTLTISSSGIGIGVHVVNDINIPFFNPPGKAGSNGIVTPSDINRSLNNLRICLNNSNCRAAKIAIKIVSLCQVNLQRMFTNKKTSVECF